MATVSVQVAASTDDARNISGDGTFNATVVTQHLGILSGVDYWNGFRWLATGIPQGASVSSATLDLFSAAASAGVTASCIFYGELSVSPATFSNTTAGKPEGRTRTTASAAKTFAVPAWITTGFGKELVDVTAIVQEIVNQGAWTSSSNLAIVGHDNGSANGSYVAHSTYDSSSARGATLSVTYTSGGGPVSYTYLTYRPPFLS